MTIPNYPHPEVKAFGERVSAAMYDASIRHSMGGLGGCRDFRIGDFDEDVRPYILAYLEGDLDSVAITYAAMRTKELEPAQATQTDVTDGIRPEDFTVDVVVKSMGGFAQINTHGVRVTHKPTGISVTCDVARSQHTNRQQAFEKLCTILSQQPATSEPVLTVEREPDYWSGGHFHKGDKPHINPMKVWSLPIGTKLYTHPPSITEGHHQDIS